MTFDEFYQKAKSVDLQIRLLHENDLEEVVQLALLAWAPVFESFQQVLGAAVYTRIYPDWRASQRMTAASQ